MYAGVSLKDSRQEAVDLVRRFRKGYLDDTALFLEKCACPFRDPIPEGHGLHVPEVPASAEAPRHDGLKMFSPSWTKVV